VVAKAACTSDCCSRDKPFVRCLAYKYIDRDSAKPRPVGGRCDVELSGAIKQIVEQICPRCINTVTLKHAAILKHNRKRCVRNVGDHLSRCMQHKRILYVAQYGWHLLGGQCNKAVPCAQILREFCSLQTAHATGDCCCAAAQTTIDVAPSFWTAALQNCTHTGGVRVVSRWISCLSLTAPNARQADGSGTDMPTLGSSHDPA